MAMIQIPAGSRFFEDCETGKKLIVIVKGTVAIRFSDYSTTLRNGDVVGLFDVGREYSEFIYETTEECRVVEYAFEEGESFPAFLDRNKDTKKYCINSIFKQLEDIVGIYKLQKHEFDALRNYIGTLIDDYKWLCEESETIPSELPDSEEILSYDFSDTIPEWMEGFYDIQKDLIFLSQDAVSDSSFIAGLVHKVGQDIIKYKEASEKLDDCKSRIIPLILNENDADLFELYYALYFKAVKKFGLDNGTVASIYRGMDYILMQAKEHNLDKEIFYASKKKRFEEAQKKASLLADNREKQLGDYSEEQVARIEGSLEKILTYADADEQFRLDFSLNVDEYKKSANKNGSDDKSRALRHKLTQQFNRLYANAFEKSVKDDSVPTIVKMFFNFGYVDEELVGIDNAVYLYNLSEHLQTDPENGVYSCYEWLKAIYEGRKDPGRNEFEVDYSDYLHERLRNKEIDKNEEKELFEDSTERVRYELENVFPTVNKTTTGRITTFCPLLSSHNIIKDLSMAYVSAEKVIQSIEGIRRVDYTAFYRETMFAAPEVGISKELINVEVLPDVILMPNIGNRGVLWQEIEGKRRTTPARMFCSVFQQEDINLQILKMTGQFRWEMCKRIQGSRWNDITDRSLTSEYFDYVQFYRKNKELSPEIKEKIKNDLVRAKNSYKELFVRDYLVWVQFESLGSPRLNKVARMILASYVPFSKKCRGELMINPMYKDMIVKFETKQKAKKHRMEGLIRKISSTGHEVPEEIIAEAEFLES